jgi:two-component system nitrogen regulation response regulator GlnG
MSRILVVDDEPAIGWSLRELLVDDGHEVEVSASVETAIETCGHFQPDAMLLDVRLPGRDGLSALPDLQALAPQARVIVMTAFGDLETAVRAVNGGAFEYLVKPFDLERVSQVVSRALTDLPGRAAPTVPGSGPPRANLLVGGSAPMQEVFRQIALVAPIDLPVLITGQTGTGKDLAARAIHAHGPRRDGPFLATSLAALAPSVIESELFGHVRGAFTGATVDRKGLFELADGGTIFLDEIGEAPADLQVKLLRVLEQREITPVGSATVRPVDVRIIAATNRDLAAAIQAGTFRADLFHRLNVFPIRMPPLDSRLDDLPALVDWFLKGFTGPRGTVTEGFLDAIRDRTWPGNIRELKHAVEYACVIARGSALRPEHLPAPAADTIPNQQTSSAETGVADSVRNWVTDAWSRGDQNSGDLHASLLRLVERTLAEAVLERTDGNLTAAARILGLDRATLRSRLGR